MSVKVCIVGCGAIGSIFGAHLARLEEVEVYAYDVNKEHVRAIHERGLRISGVADFTVHLEATSDVSQIPACDLGIVATKSTHTRRAIEQTKHIFGLASRSEEHTSELQSPDHLVCRLLLEKKKK